jgi:uncharacterized protein YeaO (DUF488 family)
MDYRHELEKLLEYLKQERDEINLKLHLGQKELRDEMQEVEKQWDEFRQRGEKALQAADDSSEDVAAALKLLGEEIKSGFEKIRKSLSN